MRVLVCGGRDYKNRDRVDQVLNYLPKKDLVIIQGNAPGADYLAKEWARENGVQCESYPADWQQYGRKAGYIRNKQMLEEGKPDLVIAFPGGAGTNMMTSLSMNAGIQTLRIPEHKPV